jgi:4-amino-4-deoxy-L-arabinose transferase-like glycosyltransferase
MSRTSHPAEKFTKSFPWSAKASQAGPEGFHQDKWWRWLEWEALLLVGIVAAIYFARLPEMSVRGEESRWATVATEMLRTGDWVVPRQQGIPFLSRPPLGSWLIASATLMRGHCDVWAVRLPAVLATLLTSLLVYGYSRTFLSRFGAFTGALAYATMGQVLQLGRVGETEAVFTFFVSASLLIWHWRIVKQWPDIWVWIAGYGLAALGALAKGPQAPIYFVAATGMFLILQHEWRRLVSWPHLAGVGVFVGIIACWQIPFFLKLGWPAVRAIWASDTAMRFSEIHLQDVLEHMVTYPVEILGCTLPWSLFLFGYLSRKLRREIGFGAASGVSHDPGSKRMVMFLAVCLAITFPTCWLIPGAHGRYFMPLYPCLAALIGLVVERSVLVDTESIPRGIWQNSLGGLSLAMVGFALAILSASWLGFPRVSVLIQERNFSLIYAVGTLAFAVFLWWLRERSSWQWGYAGVCALAACVGVTYDTVVMNFIVRKNGVTAEQVTQLKEQLLNDQKLVSFGPIHHLFAYHFQDSIALQDWPKDCDDPASKVVYFCFERNDARPLPFAWEKLAEISCDRDRTPEPEEVVIIGRRLTYPCDSEGIQNSQSHFR